LSPSEAAWSEAELHTLQVLAKFSGQAELRELVETEAGCLISLQSDEDGEDKRRVSLSLITLATALRHLDGGSAAQVSDSVTAVLDLAAMWRQTREDDFLFAVGVAGVSFEDLVFVEAVCRLFEVSLLRLLSQQGQFLNNLPGYEV
jgi:hypothetical protein